MEAHTLIQYIVIVVFGLVCCFVFIRHGRKHDRNCVRKRNNKRMHRAMDSTPSVPTTAAQPSSSSDSEPNAGGIYSLQQLQAMLKAIKKVYPKYGPRLASWWAQQGQAEWLEFLLAWCPYMPLARDKPCMYEDGVRVEVSDDVIMQWNQQDLFQGDRLLQLLREVAEVQGTNGNDDFYELCFQHLTAAAMLVGPIRSVTSFTCIVPGKANFGKTFVVKKMAPCVQELLDSGSAVPAVVCEALQRLLKTLLGSVVLCLDHYRVEVEGRGIYRAVGAQLGCAECGALESQQGGLLAPCTACRITFYCSKDCQQAHCPAHRPDCKPKELRGGGASNTGQQPAAEERVFLP